MTLTKAHLQALIGAITLIDDLFNKAGEKEKMEYGAMGKALTDIVKADHKQKLERRMAYYAKVIKSKPNS